MEPLRNLHQQEPIRNSDFGQQSFQTLNAISRMNDLQHGPATNVLIDDRGDNLLSNFLTSQTGNDMVVANDTNFFLNGENAFSNAPILVEPPSNKYSYSPIKDSSVSMSLGPVKINNSPVKKTSIKSKQSPFKKRGNFEEDSLNIVTYPKSDSKDYSHSDLPRQLMGKMFGLLKEGLFCDSVILSGSTEIRVHRLVLLAACPFILSKMSDLSQNASLKIELPQGIPLDVTSQLVHYLYDGKVTLTSDNVSHFARVANLFKLSHLIDICKDFAIMFGINQSILADKCEDIIAVVKIENTNMANFKKETKMTSKKNGKKTSLAKTPPSNQPSTEEEKNEFVTSTPSHSYGTRRASSKTPNAPANTLTENFPKSKHPIHTNAAFINSNKITSTIKIFNDSPVMAETGSRITSSFNSDQSSYDANISDTGSRITSLSNSDPTGNLSSDTGVYISNTNNDKDSFVDQENEELFGNIDELTDDCDEDADWRPHTKLKGRTFTKKGRQAKAFKKAIASFQKITKPKKITVVPEQKETYTLRPPPKKRAKEFARTEFEEQEDILSRPAEKGIVHTFSMESNTQSKKTKQRSKRTRRLMKASSYRAGQLSAVVAQIEQKADHLPENERHFICDICGNHYIFSKRAVTHIISVHDTDLEEVINAISIRKKEKVLKMCDICGYETKESNFFYIHFHRYFRHGVPLPKGMQPFKCDICGKECFTRFQLKDHKLIHQEGTPFICENCGQGFNSRTCLTSHVFHKHSKIRNHKCADQGCEKTFKTKTQLLVHMRSHTGEKPFQCPDCQYKSTTRGNMRLHLTNKHKHKSDIVKNIMVNLKPSQGDELLLDLEDNPKQNDSVQMLHDEKQHRSFSQTFSTSQEVGQLIYSNAQSSHGNQSSDQGYSTVTNLIASQEQQILYDPNDPNRQVTIQQLAAQHSLILNNLQHDQLELLPGDPVENGQVLVSSENLQHHILLHDSDNRIPDINRITMQEARSLLQQQGHIQNLSTSRHNEHAHQRLSIVQDGGKQLPQLVEVQEIQPVFLHDHHNNLLHQYQEERYSDDEEEALQNTGTLQKSSSLGQEQLLLPTQGNQSHQNLPKIQISIQDRGQMEPTVHGLILSPNTSNNVTGSPHDGQHPMELITMSHTRTPTKMYLVDINNMTGVDVNNVASSVEQGQMTNTSIDSVSYNDPQLLYQLYQQYNQNYQ